MGATSSHAPASHTERVRRSLVFRLAAVALSLAGAGTAFIAALSENRAETAEMLFLQSRTLANVAARAAQSNEPAKARAANRSARTLESKALGLLRGAHALNPDTRIDAWEAQLLYETQPARSNATLRRVTREEPENALLWVLRSQVELRTGRPKAARASYERARELDSQLPRRRPAPRER